MAIISPLSTLLIVLTFHNCSFLTVMERDKELSMVSFNIYIVTAPAEVNTTGISVNSNSLGHCSVYCFSFFTDILPSLSSHFYFYPYFSWLCLRSVPLLSRIFLSFLKALYITFHSSSICPFILISWYHSHMLSWSVSFLFPYMHLFFFYLFNPTRCTPGSGNNRTHDSFTREWNPVSVVRCGLNFSLPR